jgi:hypothetical protein
MKPKKSPAGANRQGQSIRNNWQVADTLPAYPTQDDFSTVEWLSARSGVAISTARLFAELHHFGQVRL